jgi:hypothetical protein
VTVAALVALREVVEHLCAASVAQM